MLPGRWSAFQTGARDARNTRSIGRAGCPVQPCCAGIGTPARRRPSLELQRDRGSPVAPVQQQCGRRRSRTPVMFEGLPPQPVNELLTVTDGDSVCSLIAEVEVVMPRFWHLSRRTLTKQGLWEHDRSTRVAERLGTLRRRTLLNCSPAGNAPANAVSCHAMEPSDDPSRTRQLQALSADVDTSPVLGAFHAVPYVVEVE